jgi:hypothetical protein
VMYVYEKRTAFTEEMAKLRQESKLRGDVVWDEFYKLVLNGFYGYDIMNEEKFFKCSIHNWNIEVLKVFSLYFMLSILKQ